jgi:hypothetical protein
MAIVCIRWSIQTFIISDGIIKGRELQSTENVHP